MKKILIVFSLVALLGCTSDNFEEFYNINDECSELGTSFQNDIQPIISTNCAISGCHVTGTGLPPWQTYNQISARAEDIAIRITIDMPPSVSGKSLTATEIAQIQCWAEAGTPNN